MNDILTLVYQKDRGRLAELFREKECINSTDPDGRTPLMHAVLAEDADAGFVSFLISSGADVNAKDRAQAWTALHFAARDQKVSVTKALLDARAEVDPQDAFGNTPLWRGVMGGGSPDVIAALLSRGANPGLKNKNGVSGLELAQRLGKQVLVQMMGKD